MRMVIVQKPGDNRPIGPPTAAELERHRWHATRRGTVSFAGLGVAPTLPSADAATAFWAGEPGAFWKILGSMAQRSLIIAPALYLAGERKHLLRYTLVTTAAIELVVLAMLKPKSGT